jgi:uncharacterized membrane protein YoaK (UPF0700 family)
MKRVSRGSRLSRKETPGRVSPEATRVRDTLAVILTLTTGAVDAVTFVRLGNVFSSVITGNLTLLGVAAGERHGGLAVNGGLALGGYAYGVMVGRTFAGTPTKGQPVWPPQVTRTLAVELVLLAGFSVGWLLAAGHPAGGGRLALLAVSAVAMGMQSTATRRLGPMSTTYLTSTLTGVLEGLAVRRLPEEWQRSTSILAAMVAGAVLGTLAAVESPSWVPAAILVPIAAVLACSRFATARKQELALPITVAGLPRRAWFRMARPVAGNCGTCRLR